jgi:phosphopantetheine--protein transferase-like protein
MKLVGKLNNKFLYNSFIIKEKDFCVVGKFCESSRVGQKNSLKYMESVFEELIGAGYMCEQRYEKVQMCRFSGIRKGQPYIQAMLNNEKIIFNASVSHCKQCMSICMSDKGLIGIDIEEVRQIDKSVVERLFSESDLECIEKLSNYNKEFYWHKAFTVIWTIKESCMKALGIGLKLGFNSVIIKNIDFLRNCVEVVIDEKVLDKIGSIPNRAYFNISFEGNFVTTLSAFIQNVEEEIK